MAKRSKRKNRSGIDFLSNAQKDKFGHELAALGFTPQDRDIDVRFDVGPDNERTRERIELLARYDLVRVREHSDKLWRVAITDQGYDLAQRFLLRQERKHQGPRSLTEEELEARKELRNQKRAEQMAQGRDAFGGLVDISLPSDPVLITTQTLREFQYTAAECGFSRVLTEETLEALEPNAKHRVKQAWKHTSSEGHTNIRLAMDIYVRVGGVLANDHVIETRGAIVDIRNRDWDMLMVPHFHRAKANTNLRSAENVLYMAAPKWEAVRSYPTVHALHGFYQGHVAAYNQSGWLGPFSVPHQVGNYYSGTAHKNRLHGESAYEFISHPRSLMNAETLEALQMAHPVVIDPEWVEMQEDWSNNEAWAYAERVVLPYDPLYLDFEGAGGRLPDVEIAEGVRIGISGCLIWRDFRTGRMVIAPMGGRQLLDPALQTGALAGGLPYEQVGRVVMGGRCAHGRNFPVEIGGEQFSEVDGLYVIPLASDNLRSEGVAADLPTYKEGDDDEMFNVIEDPHRIPGYVELPLRPEDALNFAEDDPERVPWFARWMRVTTRLAAKSMSMLSLLDNEHVELREAALSRQVRRSVERDRKKGKDVGIASEIVVVRKHRYVGKQKLSEEEGRTIEYSHQFRVKRHEQHHGPHTRAYRAAPEKAKPCGRCGSCRRFIVESYIKGPSNKPMKLNKTYVFRDSEDC